jgi:hypothetical protein
MFLLTALLIPRIISASLGYNQAFWGAQKLRRVSWGQFDS